MQEKLARRLQSYVTRASTYAHTAIHTLLLKEGSYKNDLSSVLRIRMHVCTVHILCSCQMK